MNLYIINEVLSGYTGGMIVIAAESLEKSRSLFADEWPNAHDLGEFDDAIANGDYKVIEGVNHPEGIVSYVPGGG